jgi:cell division septum initiation protein DivIVA
MAQTDLERFSRLVIDEIKEFRGEFEDFKDEVGARFDIVEARLSRITSELTQIVRQLDELDEQVGGLKGFAKEIDDIRARVKEIERHLGINKKIAA